MDIIKDMLKDSLIHALETSELYKKRIEVLPKGSLSIKEMNGHIYYYLAHREGSMVKNDYLGKLSPEAVKDIKEKIEKRKRYEKMLRAIEKEVKFIQKALGIKIA